MPAISSTTPAMLATTLNSWNGDADRMTTAPHTEKSTSTP